MFAAASAETKIVFLENFESPNAKDRFEMPGKTAFTEAKTGRL